MNFTRILLALAACAATSFAAKANAVTFIYGNSTALTGPDGTTSIQTWSIGSPYSAHMTDSGSVLYTTSSGAGTASGCSGAVSWGSIVEKDWSGTTLHTITSAQLGGGIGHHAITPTARGTVLAIMLENYNGACGERVVEWDLKANKVIWTWHTNDHLGTTATKLKAGSSSQDPFHINNADLDTVNNRIVMSAHNVYEVFVINHAIDSTANKTTSGDLLWRFGNPSNYGISGVTAYISYACHSARFVDPGITGATNIVFYANLSPANGTVSTGYEIKPIYSLKTSGEWDYSVIFKGTNSNSTGQNMGGMDKLFNGNWLTYFSNSSKAYEFDSANGASQTISQAVGTWSANTSNGIRRYNVCGTMMAKAVSLGDAEATTVWNANCSATPTAVIKAKESFQMKFANASIQLNNIGTSNDVHVLNLRGQQVFSGKSATGSMEISTQGWAKGAYLVKVRVNGQNLVRTISVM